MLRRPNPRTDHAFTLVELLIAAGITLVGFMGIVLMNGANLRMVRSARQSNAATLCLQERAEQLRLADWRKITDPLYLRDTLLARATLSGAPLNSITEQVKVEAFPDPEVAQRLLVRRHMNGTRLIYLSGYGLAAQRLAKVELEVSWRGSDGRRRTRATTTLMANGGISRMNLPGFGAAAGAPPAATPAPSAPPPPDDGTDPEAPPPPAATPAPTPTPTPTPSNNGNGRGNVGGKSGKK